MDTNDLTNKIMEVVSKLPNKNQKEIEKMIDSMNEKMDTDKHSINDIIVFTKGILISLQLSVYLLAYREQEH